MSTLLIPQAIVKLIWVVLQSIFFLYLKNCFIIQSIFQLHCQENFCNRVTSNFLNAYDK